MVAPPQVTAHFGFLRFPTRACYSLVASRQITRFEEYWKRCILPFYFVICIHEIIRNTVCFECLCPFG